jgi:site-specific recombinase XerD
MSKRDLEENRNILKKFLNKIENDNFSPETVVSTRSALNVFLKWYEGEQKSRQQSILSLSDMVAIDYKTYLKTATWQPRTKNGQPKAKPKTYSDTTIQKKMIILKTFLDWLYETKQISIDVGSTIKIKQVEKITRSEELLSYDDAMKLIEKGCGTNLRDRAIIATLLDSGVRRSELLNLKYSDVVPENDGMALYITKPRDNSKTIPLRVMCYWAFPELRDYRNNHPTKKPTDYFFCSSTEQHGRFSNVGLWEEMQKIAKRAGFTKRIWTHQFRHSSATLYARTGDVKNTIELAQRFGWTKTSKMPGTYINLSGYEFDNAARKRYGIPIREKEVAGMKMLMCPTCRLLQHGEAPRCTNCGTALSEEEIEKDRVAREAEDARKADEIAERVLSKLEGAVPLSAIKKMMREDRSGDTIHFDLELLKKKEDKKKDVE